MKKIDQKGFGAVGILAIVVITGLTGAVGWLVWDRQKTDTKEQQTNTQQLVDNTKDGPTPAQKQEAPKEDRRIITLNGATYSFALPAGWKHQELFAYPGPSSNEKIVQITDPTNQYELDATLFDYTGSVSEGHTPAGKFSGVNGKLYYLQTYKGTATKGFENISASACETKHCFTTVDSTYELDFTIKRTSQNYSEGVSVNAPEVELMKQIIASVKIGG